MEQSRRLSPFDGGLAFLESEASGSRCEASPSLSSSEMPLGARHSLHRWASQEQSLRREKRIPTPMPMTSQGIKGK